jgi:peptidoglycan/xylan/chitin deacetylase (PgdA/CDA1 family)
MRRRTLLALLASTLALAAAASLPGFVGSQGAIAQRAGAGCGPDAIGLARTLEIDTTGGPRFGHNQYAGRDILKDREVVLTFDDGPHKAFTRPILDALDRHCTKATFFLVGQRALTYPDIAREVARRGHTVGTHTWSHQDLAKIESDEAKKEIELGISAVQKLVGQNAAPFFRFPYLSDPSEMRAHLKRRDTGIFSIDVDSYDFKTRSATKVISNVMRQLDEKGRGIILFHDIQPSTAGAIDDLLARLRRDGYRVVHFVPRQPQTTLAAFDREIDSSFKGRRFAALPAQVPVSHRSFVNPAWEVRIIPERPEPQRGGSGGFVSAYPAGGGPRDGVRDGGLPNAPAGSTPVNQPPAAAVPPREEPARAAQPRRWPGDADWRDNVFRQW